MRHRCVGFVFVCLVVSASAGSAHAFTISRVSSEVLHRDGGKGLVGSYVGYKLTNDDGVAHEDVWVAAQFASGATIHLATNEDGVQHIGPMTAGESKLAFFFVVADAVVTTPQSHTVRAYTLAGATLATQSFSLTAEDTIQANANKVTSVSISANPSVGGTLVISVQGETGTVGGTRRLSFTPASASTWRPDAFQLETTSIAFTGGNNVTVTDQLAFTLASSAASTYVATYRFRVVGTTATSTPIKPIGYIESGSDFKHTSVTTTEYLAIPPVPVVVNLLTLTRSPTVTELTASGGNVTLAMTITSTYSEAAKLDKFVETFVTGTATYVPGSSRLNGAVVSDPSIGGSSWEWSGTLEVPANGTLVLSFQATYAAGGGTHVQRGAAFIGPSQIDGTAATGDDASAEVTIYVGNAPDSDADGLSDAKEATLGTDASDSDTDNDGLLDGVEVGADGVYTDGTDPNPKDADSDDDGLSDAVEVTGSGPLVATGATDPLDPDGDGDGLSDGLEVGVTSPVAPGVVAGRAGRERRNRCGIRRNQRREWVLSRGCRR